MSKILHLSEICPMKALERALLKERDKFCQERRTSSFGSTRIIIKKKRSIAREE